MSTPMITSISPTQGPSSGATQVEIAGSGLGTATEADDVQFGDLPAATIVSVTDSLLTVMTPPAATPGPVTVSVINPNGAVIWADAFTYMVYAENISPASGPVAGGTAVTISGSGLSAVSGVQFGAVAAVITGTATDTAITVTAPAAAAAGSVDVQLLGLSGAVLVTQPNWFTYAAAPAGPTTGSGGTTGSTSSGSTTGSNSAPGSTTTTTTTGPGQQGQPASPSGQPGSQPAQPSQPGQPAQPSQP